MKWSTIQRNVIDSLFNDSFKVIIAALLLVVGYWFLYRKRQQYELPSNDLLSEENMIEKRIRALEKSQFKTTSKNKQVKKPQKQILETRLHHQQQIPRNVAKSSVTQPPSFFSNTSQHPGLEAFWYWCDVETSLFRVYCLGRNDNTQVAPPYNPFSQRGTVSLRVEVRNMTSRFINIYWVNYKGHEIFRGELRPNGGLWNQTTWIDHPWVMRDAHTNDILIHFVPYRVIPTTQIMPTVDPLDPGVGIQRFTIRESDVSSPFYVTIDDAVLPFPANEYLTDMKSCIQFALLHSYRMGYSSWNVLKTYVAKIIENPAETKYRQIRQGNPAFWNHVWNTSARGILLAVGFIENGAYIELGSSEPLSSDRIRDLSHLLLEIEKWEKFDDKDEQPQGADGFGRAGFGRAGVINDLGNI